MSKTVLTALGVLLLLAAYAMSKPHVDITPESFVGKWNSTRLANPLLIQSDGEWAVKTAQGEVIQTGSWQYRDRQFLWAVRLGDQIEHEVNAVVEVKPGQFKLKEKDGSITTFTKIY